MNRAQLEAAVRDLDTRMSAAEQKLQQMVTAERFETAIARLATKAELQAAVADLRTAMAVLATKEEVHAEAVETRRHFDVVAESLRDDIKMIADAVLDHDRRIRRRERRQPPDEP